MRRTRCQCTIHSNRKPRGCQGFVANDQLSFGLPYRYLSAPGAGHFRIFFHPAGQQGFGHGNRQDAFDGRTPRTARRGTRSILTPRALFCCLTGGVPSREARRVMAYDTLRWRDMEERRLRGGRTGPMRMLRRACRGVALAGLFLICGSVGSAADRNFSQYPGFAEYFAANPPAAAAGPADQALARRHAPRFYLPAGHEGPIDFYRDYIAHGYLVTGDGVRIDAPTRADLNRYRDDVRAEFTHVPGTAEPRPVVYGTVARNGLWAAEEPGRAAEEFTVVTLPPGVPGERPARRNAAGRGVTAPAGGGPRRLAPARPLYRRVRGPGRGRASRRPDPAAAQLPAHLPGRRVGGTRARRALRHRRGHPLERALPPCFRADGAAGRTVPGPRRQGLHDGLRQAPDDVRGRHHRSGPHRRLRSRLPARLRCLLFLPRLPRRAAPAARPRRLPPGARYNTLPDLKPLPAQILDGYWREGNEGDWERYRSSRENGTGPAGFARAQAEVFHHNLACLRRERQGCTLE